MGLSVFQGTITQKATTGNQSTTGVGFQPTFVEFWWGDATADGSAADHALGYGVAISSSSRRAVFMCGDDGTANSGAAQSDVKCIVIHIPNVFFDLKAAADVVTLDADGFTLNWTTTDGTARVIHYRAWGGTDLTNVALLTCAAKTSTGTQAYTGAGFQPDAVMFFGSMRATTFTSSGLAWQSWKMGAANSTTSRWYTAAHNRDSLSTSQAHRKQLTTAVVAQLSSSSGTGVVDFEADLSSLDADGFTLNFGTAAGTAWTFAALCLKGPQMKAMTFSQATSTGSQATTGAGFQPSAGLFCGFQNASTTSIVASMRAFVGAAVSTSQRGTVWSGALDADASTTRDRDHDTAAAIKHLTEGTPTLNAEADFTSWDSDGFTLNWGTADGTARQICAFVIGAAGGGGGGSIVPLLEGDMFEAGAMPLGGGMA